MKRLIIAAVILCIVSTAAIAQLGDARTRAMAGAMTGLADDVNAMAFNPAGIGFLKKSYFSIDTNATFGMTNRIMFGEAKYPWVYEDWNNPGEYIYWDEFLDDDIYFDPGVYGFPYDPADDESYQSAVNAYMNFRDYYGAYEMFQNLFDVGAIPRVAWLGKLFGLATITDMEIDLIAEEYSGSTTDFIMEIKQSRGLMAAAGLKLGIFGVGGNFRYITNSTDTLVYDADDFEGGPPETMFSDLLTGTSNKTEGESEIALGVGGMAVIGPFNVGAYIDNLLFFLNTDPDSEDTKADFLGIFEGLSVGASWTPFDRKMAEKRGVLNLIASLDLRNFGSVDGRELAVGVETGLNLGNVIVVSGRAGYRQPLPGTLATMIESFDPYIGMYSAGIGAKFLFMRLDIAATFPFELIADPPRYGMPEARLDEPLANFMLNLSVSF